MPAVDFPHARTSGPRLFAWAGRCWILPLRLAWLGLSCVVVAAEKVKVADERALKVAILLKITSFIDWPAAAFASPTAPFVIEIAGEDPFGAVFGAVLDRDKILGREVVVRRNPRGEPGPEAHLLFVGSMSSARRNALLASLAGKPVVIVGEQEGLLESGGTVRLVVKDSLVRFELNQQSAKQAGLTMHSRFLEAAIRVVRADKAN